MLPAWESPGSLLLSEPKVPTLPSFHNPPRQHLHFVHLQWAQWEVSQPRSLHAAAGAAATRPHRSGRGEATEPPHSPGQGSWQDPTLGDIPGRLHSCLHRSAEHWCLTVPISTPHQVTPNLRGDWRARISHSPFSATSAAAWCLQACAWARGEGQERGRCSTQPGSSSAVGLSRSLLHAHRGPSDIFLLCSRHVGNLSGK